MMVRRSRLRTKAHRVQFLSVMFVILIALGGIVGIGYIYRQQLITLFEVWDETFPVEAKPAENVRGTIYDRNFKELAQTLERVSLYARPRELENVQGAAELLSGVLGVSETELLQRLRRKAQLVWLRRDIGQGEEEAIHGLELSGIYLHREFARKYPRQSVGGHLVGYAENDLGLAGIEHYYNNLLSDDHVRQKDIPNIDLRGEKQTSGVSHDLVLTVDVKIQTIIDKYVADLGENLGRVQIGSLLVETNEGELIASANYPSYNPNTIWQYESEVLENILLSSVLIPEEIRRFFRDASLLQGGWEQSTQVYPWSLVAGKVDFAGQIRLWDRLQLSTESNVDLSGGKKQTGTIPDFIDCRPALDFGTVPRNATPVKVLLGMTHLLNGGKKIQPHFLNRVLAKPSQKEYFFDAFQGQLQGRNVLPALVSREMSTLLRAQGTPGILGSVTLSGETVYRIPAESGSEYVRDRMSVVVIPADKTEMILLLVSRQMGPGPFLVDDSDPEYLSKTIDKILPSVVALQQVSYNVSGLVEAAEPKDENFQKVEVHTDTVEKNLAGMLGDENLLMPDLTGLSLRKGLRMLQRAELEVHVEGTGRIVEQSPKAGQDMKKGERCLLTLKKDHSPKEILKVRPLKIKSGKK